MFKWFLAACAALQIQPVSAETLETYLERSGSHAVLVLEVPFDQVQLAITEKLLDQYNGSKPDPTDALREDTLTWSAKPSAVALAQDGTCFSARSKAAGKARIKGKLGSKHIYVRVDPSVDLRVKASLKACPSLRTDWSLDPGFSGGITLTEADLYGLSLRGLLQGDLDRMVTKELGKITADLKDPAFLGGEVGKLWTNLCTMSSNSDTLTISPIAVAARQPLVQKDSLRFTFIVSGDVVKVTEPPSPCPALPAKLILLE